jgi:predicted nucleic acid-binding Zn ribbon protein
LGELPADASRAMRKVAGDIGLLLGLRLAVDEDRPLPYSARFCAQRCELSDHRQASRVLHQLVQAGVVEFAGTLKPRGQPFGTKLYRAPSGMIRAMSDRQRTICPICGVAIEPDEPDVVEAVEIVPVSGFGEGGGDVADGMRAVFHERCFPEGDPSYRRLYGAPGRFFYRGFRATHRA